MNKSAKEEKKVSVKVSAKKKAVKKTSSKKESYFYGLGRRKTAVAQVRIFFNQKKSNFLVNGKKMEEYFPTIAHQNTFQDALRVSGFMENVKVETKAQGGGLTGQVEAIRLGIARALVKYDEALIKVLRAEGFLTRDARKVERKKPGLKKARRAPQWAKR